jgi:hypothetical protein
MNADKAQGIVIPALSIWNDQDWPMRSIGPLLLIAQSASTSALRGNRN